MRYGLLSGGTLALLLAGCAPYTSNLYGEDDSAKFPDEELRYATADGRGVLTQIHGRAFDLSQDEFDKVVLDAMQGANAGTPARFTRDPGPNDRTSYRVVLQFNGTTYDQSYRLCKGGGGGETTTAPATRLAAAFCDGRSMISAVTGETPDSAGPDDPNFRSLVRQVVFRLFAIRPDIDVPDGGEATDVKP